MKTNVFCQLQKGEGKQQVIGLPYLGGYSNAFTDVCRYLDDSMEVWSANPPGHGGCRQPLLEDIDDMVDLYYQHIKEIIKDECIIYGHSMGGVIAYFLIQRIMREKIIPTDGIQLILSGCNTPADFLTKDYASLSDEDLITKVKAYGGLPEELIAEREFVSYLLPILRADYRVLQSASHLDYEPMAIPVYLMWGDIDPVTPIVEVLQWKRYFATDIELVPIVKGKHMFIHDQADTIAEHIKRIHNAS